MIFTKKFWLDRSSPLFNFGSSPEIDAENLNIFEENIAVLHESIDNMSTAYGTSETTVVQPILLTESELEWSILTDSTDSNVFTYDDLNNTITFKKPGTFSFRTRTTYSSTTDNLLQVTTKIIDSALTTVWQTSTTTLNIANGKTQTLVEAKPLVFIQSDLPKTLKIVFSADGTGMSIDNADYSLNTLASGASATDHSSLTGRSDTDSHPISSITDLDTTLTGASLAGEAV